MGQFIKDNQGHHLEFHHLLQIDIESFYLLLSFVHFALQVDTTKVASCGGMIIPELCSTAHCTILQGQVILILLFVLAFPLLHSTGLYAKQFTPSI